MEKEEVTVKEFYVTIAVTNKHGTCAMLVPVPFNITCTNNCVASMYDVGVCKIMTTDGQPQREHAHAASVFRQYRNIKMSRVVLLVAGTCLGLLPVLNFHEFHLNYS